MSNNTPTSEGKEADFKTLQSPVFGKLVWLPDWNEWLAFRQFPYLREFKSSSEGCRLTKKERGLVKTWQNPTSGLLEIWRDSCVLATLQHAGVFSVQVEMSEEDSPTPAQEKAFEEFEKSEKTVSANVLDALRRYYHYARRTMPDCFDHLKGDERPENPSIAQLAKLVWFDGIAVCRTSAKGTAPMLLSWKPIWEEEHGLQMLLFRDQVILLGQQISVSGSPRRYPKRNRRTGWGKEMTTAEWSAWEEFISHVKPGS